MPVPMYLGVGRTTQTKNGRWIKKLKKLNIVSLFSGAGAFECGLENINAPFNLLWYSEIDKYASKAYSLIHNVEESRNVGDITKCEPTGDADIDILTYGFPCQDISVAGAKRGFFSNGEKTRSGLFFDALRIIRQTKPKIAVAENVKNLTNPKMRPTFDIVLYSLEDAGYNNYWKVLNASDYGLPQNRERVFIVSIRKDIDTGEYKFPNPVALESSMSDYLEDHEKIDPAFYLSSDKTASVIRHDTLHKGHIVKNPVCDTLLSRDYKDPKVIRIAADMNHYVNDQMNRLYDPSGLCPTLKTVSGGGREIKIEDDCGRYRKLTPLEYFRLMGFKDEDYYILAGSGISKTQLYKMMGNSIAVNVATALMETVVNYLKEK